MLTIIDSGIANIASVLNACRRIGAAANVAREANVVLAASGLILPGVGTYADGMDSLRRFGLVHPIRDAASADIPILGICLGMQLLADEGEEFGRHTGLGLLPGRTVELKPAVPEGRVPNMGWCLVHISAPGQGLFKTLGAEESFYFAHSFHLVCAEPADVVAVMPWGDGEVVAAVRRGNVHGVQFHPEKSQDAGLDVLHAFWMAVKERMEG